MVNLRQLVRDVIVELDLQNTLQNTNGPRAPSPRKQRHDAERFLENLDPNSQEGLWFEALAEGYPTRLEAAIVYLREVKRE